MHNAVISMKSSNVHRLVLPPCRCKLYAHVITCALFVAVNEAGSPSLAYLHWSVSQCIAKLSFYSAKSHVARVSYIDTTVTSGHLTFKLTMSARAMRFMYTIYNRLTC